MPEAPAKPSPAPKVNRIGLEKKVYEGSESTLCSGCGHDSITAHIISAYYDLGVDPYRVAKFSGIGCSSKTPAYFIARTHGFNGVHGRMPSVATGALVANRTMHGIGISGDGDTASIGLGQFCHLIRRNIPLVYIIEDNGVYGLTKGQFSATADLGTKMKGGKVNEYSPIDCCALAIELGCGFVARSFSGDHKQMPAILKAAFSHKGTAVIDVISPCITFNNHEGSTKNYQAARDNDIPLHEIGYTPYFAPITVDYPEGSTIEVTLHDGSKLALKKLARDYNPTERMQALTVIEEGHRQGKYMTGILFIDPKKQDFQTLEGLPEEPLVSLTQDQVRPGREALEQVMEELR